VIRAESDYNPEAVSPRGAQGLMQLMPSVAKSYGLSDPFSPEDNVRAGTALLGELLNEYDGDYKLALSAYNAGPAAVKSHDGVPDYPETKNYIKKVIDSYLKNR
jgi:soluble lytic murein transglycosylase